MTWRKSDNLDPAYENVKVEWFRIGSQDSSFDTFSSIVELLINAHTHLNDNLYKIFAKYLFMSNPKAIVTLAYRAENQCLIYIGYENTQPPRNSRIAIPQFCGQATYRTDERGGEPAVFTTMQEVDTDTICNFKMPGEAFRAYRKDFNLKNLKLME